MDMKRTAHLLCIAGVLIALLASAACRSEVDPANSTLEVTSGKDANASVSGTVTYRERLALSDGASLVVEIRDTSYADAAAPLVARQTISSPGQVPIKFKVGYNRDDINPRNTYSISASIIEADGRLAFTNDTAFDVITGGNPSKVDMLLVLVQPPPDLIPDGSTGSDWRDWVEVPARVTWANLIPNEPENLLQVGYYQSTIEGCARPGNESLEVDGYGIIARVTLMQPPQTPWAIPCDEDVVELDTVLHVDVPLETGQTYRVTVNDVETTTFTLPRPGMGFTFIDESPIESAEVILWEETPPQYRLRVVSGMPRGSGCSQFNGYEIRRSEPNRIEVVITHHEVSEPNVVCTADYPIVETVVPLGSDIKSGVEYTVSINSEVTESFTAR